jgi:hypothetical protein
VDINLYALEVMTKARLADLRADAARRVLLASLRPPQRSVWAALRCALQRGRNGTSGRGIGAPSRGQVLNSRIAGPDSAPGSADCRVPMMDFKT